MRSWLLFMAASALLAEGLPSAGELQLKGHAEWAGRAVRLTRATRFQAGAVWLARKQAVRSGFDTEFTFRFSDAGGLGNGADGLAFVVQNNAPGVVGGVGGSGGFGSSGETPGIAFSLAVFLDSFRNSEHRDPSDNSMQICINGTSNQRKWPPSRLAIVPNLRTKLKDGREHRARIVYRPPLLAVYLDEQLLAQTPADLALVSDAEGKSWVGFTASTGNGYEIHDLLSWDWSSSAESAISMVDSSISFVLKACLPGKNLCTPEEPLIEEKGAGMYHVVLPAHLEWGAAVPNIAGRDFEVVQPHGLVCWDVERGAEGCGGPEVGLLSRKVGGKIEFSVKDTGRTFADNQGYFEFDVRLK